MKGYIYKYTFSDGKVYIGQTRRRPEVRHREHLSKSVGKTNTGFWDAYQKLGEPEFEIIDTIEEKREIDLVAALNEAETYYIEQFQAADPQYGYNKKSSGTVASHDAMKLNDAFRDIWERMIEPHHEFFKSVVHKIFQKTEPLTDEEKDFIRENIMISDNMFYDRIKDFNLDNLSENSDDDDFWMGEAYEWFLVVFDDYATNDIASFIQENADAIIKKKTSHIIQQVDKEGNVIREFLSNKEIMEAFNLVRIDNVLNVLKGRQKSAYGFYWRYKDE